MILCDIGNTHFHFWNNGAISHIEPKKLRKNMFNEEIYYISVNEQNEKILQKTFKNIYNLESIVKPTSKYFGLGVDRCAACLGIQNGIIVDAGSAISVDVMIDNQHQGGYILPGLYEFIKSYERISSNLKSTINFGLELDKLPNNTKDAISYGILKSIILSIKQTIDSKDQKIYFTGGDGKYLAKFFPQAIYDESLVFRGLNIAITNVLQEKRATRRIYD